MLLFKPRSLHIWRKLNMLNWKSMMFLTPSMWSNMKPKYYNDFFVIFVVGFKTFKMFCFILHIYIILFFLCGFLKRHIVFTLNLCQILILIFVMFFYLCYIDVHCKFKLNRSLLSFWMLKIWNQLKMGQYDLFNANFHIHLLKTKKPYNMKASCII
jgi:hypothetical protein